MNISKNESLLDLRTFAGRIADLMPRLCRAMMRREFSCMSEDGASTPQMWALEIIREQKECPQRLLLDALQLKASTGTVFVDRLCRMGLARRTQNPRNRREVLLGVTRKGEAALKKARSRRAKEAQRLFAPLPAGRRRAYLELLESVAQTFRN